MNRRPNGRRRIWECQIEPEAKRLRQKTVRDMLVSMRKTDCSLNRLNRGLVYAR